jgi:hypothetical protein
MASMPADVGLLKDHEHFDYVRRDAAEVPAVNGNADLNPEEEELDRGGIGRSPTISLRSGRARGFAGKEAMHGGADGAVGSA